MPSAVTTIRDKIMDRLATGFKNIAPGQPGYENYSVAWDIVSRRPVDTKQVTNLSYILGIYDVKEKKFQQIGYTRCHLTVVVEFFLTPMLGDTPENLLNTMLGEIQRFVLSDVTQGGFAVETVEIANELDLESTISKVAAGVVTFDVTYRHKVNDPFSQ